MVVKTAKGRYPGLMPDDPTNPQPQRRGRYVTTEQAEQQLRDAMARATLVGEPPPGLQRGEDAAANGETSFKPTGQS